MRSPAIVELISRAVPASIVMALGSNLGNRLLHLRQAIDQLSRAIRIARVSSLFRTDPVDCEPGAGDFLNLVLVGATRFSAWQVLQRSGEIERQLGRAGEMARGAGRSRLIDIDLILYSSQIIRHRLLQVPHPRFQIREFVMAPLRELNLPWIDPSSMRELAGIQGEGRVERLGPLY